MTTGITNQLFACRKRDGDGATRTAIVGRCHRSPHEFNEFFHQSQADAGSAGGAGEGIFHAVKIIKDFLQGLTGNPRSRIGHHDFDMAAFQPGSDMDVMFRCTFAEFHAVFNQVD